MVALGYTQTSGTNLTTETTAPADSQRAVYHLTPASGWLSDPQRPVYAGGQTNLYYLASELDNGPGGWHHVTTTDDAVFADAGIAIPLATRFPAT
jgi:levanbiose-producing levanase